MIPRVVDISHHNVVDDFALLPPAGIWGVIHKASQGKAYVDPDYAQRRLKAKGLPLLWGAYHFGTGDPIALQLNNFLAAARPDDRTLCVLDFEDNRLSNMSIIQAVQWLRLFETKMGRKAAIYSGNRIKENIGTLSMSDRAYLTSHRLWLCQYGPTPKLPMGFKNWWLWQFTGDNVGPPPHRIQGISGYGIDLNTYTGTQIQLEAEWP